MSIDMKQFHSVFFEESQEHLDEMEHILLELDVDQPDAEQLNSIFRAAHSIKGGSGIFGFDALGAVTHILESLLDKIRQGSQSINAPMVDLLLNSVDILKGILCSYRENPVNGRENSTINWDAVNLISEKLEAVIHKPLIRQSDDGDGYGFFSDTESDAPDESYGFFSEPVLPDPECAFGFFDDVELPVVVEQAHPISVTSDNRAAMSKIENSHISSQLSPASESSPGKNKSENFSQETTSIRVDVNKVDQLINLIGEIVITQSMLNLIGQQLDGALGEKFQGIASDLERNTREIQEAVMSIRMLPISFVFNRFPRVVRDLSSKLGKSIELIIEGGDTELDKGLTEKLVDPLTHLVRNSIDHGIEAQQLRLERGKNATGTVILKAAQQGGNIVISITDDGGGLNRERILAKAKEKNITISENPSDEEVWQLIFAPGFSTASEITDMSGRGVGLDVVQRNVKSMGGRIDIVSHSERGATFTITLPLTLAIVDGMCVSVGEQTFIIPLVHIVESMQPAEKDIKTLAGNDQLLLVRDQYWPILPLYKSMQLDPQYTEVHKGIAVLIETSKHKFALFVDALAGQQQVVIKSLEQHYKRVQGISGATIMGDGSVALILDVESLGDSGDNQLFQYAS